MKFAFFRVVGLIAFGFYGTLQADILRLQVETPLQAAYLITGTKQTAVRVDIHLFIGEADFDGPEGQSHFLEHLVAGGVMDFEGGALRNTFGNASASATLTEYYNYGDPEDLDTLLQQARQVFDTPRMPPEFMRQEREIIVREYDFRVAEHPAYFAFSDLIPRLWQGSPLSRSVIGTPENIRKFPLEKVLAAHRRLYVPANAVLTVTAPPGIIDQDRLSAGIAALFGDLKAGARVERPWARTVLAPAKLPPIEVADKATTVKSLMIFGISNRPLPGDPQGKQQGRDAVKDHALLRLLNTWQNSRLPGSLIRPSSDSTPLFLDQYFSLSRLTGTYVELEYGGRFETGLDHAPVSQKLQDAWAATARSGIAEKTLARLKKRLARRIKRDFKTGGFQRKLVEDLHRMNTPPHENQLTLNAYLDAVNAIEKSETDHILRALVKNTRSGEIRISPPKAF